MTQAAIVAACEHKDQKIKTQHGRLCVDCFGAYCDAKPKRQRRPRTASCAHLGSRVPAWGDYATIAILNTRRKAGAEAQNKPRRPSC